jgi:predicted TPR repeat methyltransferase
MRGMVESVLGLGHGSDVRWLDVLDLGCGLGQAGEHFRPLANRLVGLDVSKASVEMASRRGVYDEVLHGDIIIEEANKSNKNATEALQPASADLVLLSDVAPYFGDLHRLVTGLVTVLRPGAFILLNLDRPQADECPSSAPAGGSQTFPQSAFVLRPNGRWTHCPYYVEETFRSLGLEVRRTAVLTAQSRYRRGQDGLVVRLDRPLQQESIVYLLKGPASDA